MMKKYTTMIHSLLSGKLDKRGKRALAQQKTIEREMQKQWETAGVGNSTDPSTGEKIWKKIKYRIERNSHRTVVFLFRSGAVAAVLILLLTGVFYFYHSSPYKPAENFIEIVADANQMYVLPDSSHVWMSSGSSIRFAENFLACRKVWLKGNSTFEVYKQDKIPFMVYIDKAFIEVTGTCFHIRQSDPIANEITLYNGTIEFHIETTKEKINLNPKQSIVYNSENSEIQLKKIENIEWKNGYYKFTNISLEKLILKVNEMFDSNIYLSEDIDESQEFTGSIGYNESRDNVIEKICYSLNLHRKDINGQILLLN